jgi:hypothetical protein
LIGTAAVNPSDTSLDPVTQKPKPTPKSSGASEKPAETEEGDVEVTAAQALVNRDVRVYISVLDPKNVADIFGTRISKRYLAVQITVRNKNKDFQLLIGDVSLDMSRVVNTSDHPELRNYQSPTPYRPSSNDLSLVRGVSEKGTDYDRRNLIFRALRGAGSIAASLIGVMSFGPSYAPGIATFNGPLIEAYKDVFPDETVNQLNRLNDSAYAVNTLVPKQSSKVMVAFLDQAMFMSKDLRKKFRDDPMSIVGQMDFRKVVGIVHGSFIAEISEQPLLLTVVVVKQDELNHFKDDHPVVKGYIIGRGLTDAIISIESGPQGATVELDGAPEAERLNFKISSDTRVNPGEIFRFKVAKGQQVQHIPLEARYLIGNPKLDKIDKPGGNQGQSVNLVLTGSNFINGVSKVTISPDQDIEISTDEVTPTSIKTTFVIGAEADPVVRKVRVENGDGFPGNAKDFTVKKKP